MPYNKISKQHHQLLRGIARSMGNLSISPAVRQEVAELRKELDRQRRGAETAAARAEDKLKQMTQDALEDRCLSCLSELFDAVDVAGWKETPVKKYLESMSKRSHRANALAAGTNDDGCPRSADHVLRERCAKLIEELPDKSVEKHNLTRDSELCRRSEQSASLNVDS